MVQYAGLAEIGMILSLNQRLYGLLMVYRVVENSLDGVGARIRTVVGHLLGVRKNVGDQSCLICMSKW